MDLMFHVLLCRDYSTSVTTNILTADTSLRREGDVADGMDVIGMSGTSPPKLTGKSSDT